MHLRFDAGTIVLDPSASGVDPQQLPGVAWDPRVRAWRAPADAYASVLVRLADTAVRLPDVSDKSVWRAPELRWYQRAALDAWHAAGGRGVIVLPTGAGKTIVAIAAMADLGVPTLCLVPTRVLLDQWANAIASCREGVGRLGDGQRRVAPITVATYASATTWAARIGDRFGLVIVDEAHHVGAECPREVLEMLVAPARLGLTATPADNPALDAHVGPIVYALAVGDLVGDALASFEERDVPITLTADEDRRYREARATFVKAYRPFAESNPGASWRDFQQAARKTKEGRGALVAWRKSREVIAFSTGKRESLRELLAKHTDARVLVFTGDNATAYAIARELLVSPITHEIKRPEREATLDRFRRGDANVLVSAQVLDEGLDVPEAEVAIVVGGTASQRRHVQRVGRVLRPRPGKTAIVYTLTAQSTVEVAQARRRSEAMTQVSRGRPAEGPSLRRTP